MCDPVVSVALCTHNRCDYLQRALASLQAQQWNNGSFEVLVIDNCSTDATREVVALAQREWSGRRLRYVLEEQLGLSHARNRALREARSDLIAFLDDDALVPPHWVAAIHRAFREVTPRPAVVSGPVRLLWEAACPDWIQALLADASDVDMAMALFSGADYGPEPRWLHPGEIPVGTNAAFDRQILLREQLQFPIHLGRRGRSLLAGEETELMTMLRRRGYEGYYVPEIYVDHAVPAQRMTPEYAWQRVFCLGRTGVLQWRLQTRPTFGQRLIYLASCLREYSRFYLRRPAVHPPSDRFRRIYTAGTVREALRGLFHNCEVLDARD